MPASNPASSPLTRLPCSREKLSSQKRRYSVVKLQAHTEKGTCTRDFCYVAKANITPDEEFKTEVHSIKREAKRKFVGALTKFIIATLNATMISREERKLINLGQRETLISLSITPHAQTNSHTNVLHSSTTGVEKIHR